MSYYPSLPVYWSQLTIALGCDQAQRHWHPRAKHRASGWSLHDSSRVGQNSTVPNGKVVAIHRFSGPTVVTTRGFRKQLHFRALPTSDFGHTWVWIALQCKNNGYAKEGTHRKPELRAPSSAKTVEVTTHSKIQTTMTNTDLTLHCRVDVS